MSSQNPQVPEGPVRVTIFGQPYNLRSPNTSEHVLLIAQIVDQRMRQIASHLAVHDVAKVAVLAALNFADELQAQKEYYESELRSLTAEEPPSFDEPVEEIQSGTSESRGGASWFEDIFDADSYEDQTVSSEGRMSRQLMSKLQERRPLRRERAAPPLHVQNRIIDEDAAPADPQDWQSSSTKTE